MPKHRTAADFLRDLEKADRTVADWCREKGFSQQLAYRVINGRSVGRWGEARAIAKAMGLPLPDMRPAQRGRTATATA